MSYVSREIHTRHVVRLSVVIVTCLLTSLGTVPNDFYLTLSLVAPSETQVTVAPLFSMFSSVLCCRLHLPAAVLVSCCPHLLLQVNFKGVFGRSLSLRPRGNHWSATDHFTPHFAFTESKCSYSSTLNVLRHAYALKPGLWRLNISHRPLFSIFISFVYCRLHLPPALFVSCCGMWRPLECLLLNDDNDNFTL